MLHSALNTWEREILEKLLAREFAGREELRLQLRSVMAKPLMKMEAFRCSVSQPLLQL